MKQILYDYNEKLKETIVQNFSANYAKTTYFEDHPLIPVPFYETEIRWNNFCFYFKDQVPDIEKCLEEAIEEIAKMNDVLTEEKIGFKIGEPSIESSLGVPKLFYIIIDEKYED